MAKESTKAESQSKALLKKVKDCIAKGDYEQAKRSRKWHYSSEKYG